MKCDVFGEDNCINNVISHKWIRMRTIECFISILLICFSIVLFQRTEEISNEILVRQISLHKSKRFFNENVKNK